MRRQHDVVELAERMVERQRLDVVDVEAGAGDLLACAAPSSSAASSTIGPREVLMSNAVGFISASSLGADQPARFGAAAACGC